MLFKKMYGINSLQSEVNKNINKGIFVRLEIKGAGFLPFCLMFISTTCKALDHLEMKMKNVLMVYSLHFADC